MSVMKNIICPVSNEKVAEHISRITALLTVITFIAYILTGFLPFALLALFDFFARSYQIKSISLFSKIATKIGSILNLESQRIDKAPKIFASRLGFVFSLLIVAFNLFGLLQTSYFVSGILILFATMECILNFCIGCYIYSWFVLPIYKKL